MKLLKRNHRNLRELCRLAAPPAETIGSLLNYFAQATPEEGTNLSYPRDRLLAFLEMKIRDSNPSFSTEVTRSGANV
jgi:hypothetical protein